MLHRVTYIHIYQYTLLLHPKICSLISSILHISANFVTVPVLENIDSVHIGKGFCLDDTNNDKTDSTTVNVDLRYQI